MKSRKKYLIAILLAVLLLLCPCFLRAYHYAVWQRLIDSFEPQPIVQDIGAGEFPAE